MDNLGYIFAFGSLVNPAEYRLLRAKFQLAQAEAEVFCLKGYRRLWDVAMNNAETIPGYKRYLDTSGRQRKLYVAFANIEPAPCSQVHGVLIPASEPVLAHLDRRERNYQRIQVAGHSHVSGRDCKPVWAYLGSETARRRFHDGFQRGQVVVQQDYRERIVAAYRKRGLSDRFTEEDSAFNLDVVELLREDIPHI